MPVSDSHTERQPPYCTILTIDFIIVFSSPPASPSLIFTTGTSITLMACGKKKTNQQEAAVKHIWVQKARDRRRKGRKKMPAELTQHEGNVRMHKEEETGEGAVCVLAKFKDSDFKQATERRRSGGGLRGGGSLGRRVNFCEIVI